MVRLHLNDGEEVHLEALASGPQKRLSEYRRFAILLLGSLTMICASFGYAFNLISSAMQSRYNFTLRDMTTITTCGLVFGFFMLPYGFLFDYAGPVPIAGLAIVTVTVGTIGMALCFQGAIEGSVVKLSIFNAILNIGVSLFDLVACMTVISYFPTNRGAVIALLKVFAGLGSAIVGSLKSGFFGTHVDWYYYFLLSFSAVMGVLLMIFMRLPEYHLTGYEMAHLSDDAKATRLATKTQYLKQRPPMRRFAYAFVVLVLLIIYLPTESAVVSYKSLDATYQLAFAVVTIALTLALLGMVAPLSVLNHSSMPFSQRSGSSTPSSQTISPSTSAPGLAELDDAAALTAVGKTENSKSEPIEQELPHEMAENVKDAGVVAAAADWSHTPSLADGKRASGHGGGRHIETEVDYIAPQYQGTFLQNLLTINLWALWWSIFCVIGAEFVIIYNATFILGSLQSAPVSGSLSTLLTVLNGVGSAVGRLLMSYFEVWSQRRPADKRIPLTIALFFPTTSVIISLVLFLVVPAVALPLPYIVAALGNGFLAATIVLVSRTIFAKDPAKHYNFCFSATMMGSIFHNRLIFGEWYAAQADKQHHTNHLCYGKECVLGSMVLMLGLSCTGFISSTFLHLRYTAYCKRVLAERAALRAREDEAGAALSADGALVDSQHDGFDQPPPQEQQQHTN